MPRERTFSHAELVKMFPDGLPVSVIMIVDREELTPAAKNAIITEIQSDMCRAKAEALRKAKVKT